LRACKEFNKKYRNLFYDSGLEAVVGHACAVVVNQAGLRTGGLRWPGAVLEQKRAFQTLRIVVDKSREPRQGRRGDATTESFAVSSIFGVLQ
jgi:hypothetical protein